MVAILGHSHGGHDHCVSDISAVLGGMLLFRVREILRCRLGLHGLGLRGHFLHNY